MYQSVLWNAVLSDMGMLLDALIGNVLSGAAIEQITVVVEIV